MAARPLYELAAGFNALFDLVLDESMDLQLLEEGLQSIECALEEKCAGGIALIVVAALGLWYLPFGTVGCLVVIGLTLWDLITR